MTELAMIVAAAENRVIGRDNQIPWHLSEDLKRFKKITMGHPLIMGRKTFESLGKPLPGRPHLVLSRQADYQPEGVRVFGDLPAALQAAGDRAFVIGGEAVFKEAYPRATTLYFTRVHATPEGDAYFPDVPWEQEFVVEDEQAGQAADGTRYTFVTARRRM